MKLELKLNKILKQCKCTNINENDLKKDVLTEFYKTILDDLQKSAFIPRSWLHRFCSMNNMKDGISGTGPAYPVEVQVEYSIDSLCTMPSQSVT